MSKSFREWNVDQVWLLAPSIDDFVPEGHAAHLIREVVRTGLDLSAIDAAYGGERGQPPYHPAMMVALLLDAYSQGIYASRRIARACEERLDVMAVTALERPDFRTISDFRKRHLAALAGLFGQVLALCRQAGLAKLGHVALDGTKIKANASKHKAMSYGRMVTAESRLTAEIAGWLAQAAAADAADDEAFGAERRGDELPDWVADKQRRLAKIQEARAALEAEVARAAEQARRAQAVRGTQKRPGRQPKVPSPTPPDKAQRNFTDPDSRVLKTKDGFIQGYNAQAAVDGEHQIIVSHGLTNSMSDQGQLTPALEAIETVFGAPPRELSADAGYCSEENFKALEGHGIKAYIATGRQRHGSAAAGARNWRTDGRIATMARKLRRGGRRSRYRRRKQIVEPVFGQIKQARGFRQFLLRGRRSVEREWALVCTAHNLTKLTAVTA